MSPVSNIDGLYILFAPIEAEDIMNCRAIPEMVRQFGNVERNVYTWELNKKKS